MFDDEKQTQGTPEADERQTQDPPLPFHPLIPSPSHPFRNTIVWTPLISVCSRVASMKK